MDDEFRVLSVVLRERFKCLELPLCVINSHFDKGNFSTLSLDFLTSHFPTLEREAVEEAVCKSQLKTPVELRFDADLSCVLGTPERGRELFPETVNGKRRPKMNGWKQFHARFPLAGGIIQVSRVGFNARRDQAIVCAGQQFDWMVGSGDYFFLLKPQSYWEIEAHTAAWIS